MESDGGVGDYWRRSMLRAAAADDDEVVGDEAKRSSSRLVCTCWQFMYVCVCVSLSCKSVCCLFAVLALYYVCLLYLSVFVSASVSFCKRIKKSVYRALDDHVCRRRGRRRSQMNSS